MKKIVSVIVVLVAVVFYGGVANAVELEESMIASAIPVSSVQAVSQLPGAGVEGPVVVVDPPATDPDLKWAFADIVITDGSTNVGTPSVAAAPSGELFMAIDVLGANGIRIYHSTDGGQDWSYLVGLNHGTETRNPALAYAESDGDRWLVVVYEHVGSDVDRGLHAARFNADDPGTDFLFTDIEASITWLDATTELHPQITCDFPDYTSGVYFYVTYAKPSIDYYPVFFSRSTDQAQTWSTPLNITGGSENTSVETRPEIAYSAHRNDVYVAFTKPGWNGTGFTRQVWVTNNTSFGGAASWEPPVQVTDFPDDISHPAVAAAWDSDTVLVLFTIAFDDDDHDVANSYSTDGGTVWSNETSLSGWTFEKEDHVDLAVSQATSGRFHAVYRHRDPAASGSDIWYSWADVSSPGTWSTPVDVNKQFYASGDGYYPRPAICADLSQAPEDEAALAWTRYFPSYNVLFDSAILTDFNLIFADGFETSDDSAWSSSSP